MILSHSASEFTLERSPVDVSTVEEPSDKALTSFDTRGLISERGHVGVVTVEEPSTRVALRSHESP